MKLNIRTVLAFAALMLLGLLAVHFQYSLMALAGCGMAMAAAPVALTPEQAEEFKSVLERFKEYASMFPGLKELSSAEGGFAAIKKLPETIKDLAEGYKLLQGENAKLRKAMLEHKTGSGVHWVGEVPFVSDDCAKALAGIYVITCARQEKWPAAWRETAAQQRVLGMAAEYLGMETKAALTTTEIPVPTIYVPQIVELVWKYGQARQFATVFPLGSGTVKLPRLKAGEDKFSFLGVGAAGMSQALGEKKVTAELVTFTPNKFGGLIRIPTELEEDTFIPLGQFLARYIARRFAFGEDDTMFNADGTGTYANISGISKYCQTNNAYLTQLGAGKTKPSDAGIADFRAMRGQVSAAAYFESAYYMHPTMDALLVTFNTINNPRIYERLPNGQATLDGFPIRWTGVHQPYGTAAAASANLATFGALSYAYLGERGQPRVQTSLDVFFASDEIAMRALERIDVELMAIDALSTLMTAAA